MKFYNTLTNKIETFKEIKQGTIGLYTCGPTVYDYSHIGNFRSYMFEDLVKRYFIYKGYQVNHVMNITDIDDKTIKKANEMGTSLEEVTSIYIKTFMEDIETLNILKADHYPRATEHIDEMLETVDQLYEKGYAYKKDNSVYFSIEKFSDYGKLANISRDALKIGTSVDADEYDKDDVQDFVLWKGKKQGEPSWKSEKFGDGRPGWHLECSAMSSKYLGNHFDIHMGGVDNIFPHHENEIAQSQCATGEQFVNYWIHCQHLVVDNQKMSKSLGNFYILKDLLEKGYDPMEIRYLLISTHYRKLLNFTFDGLHQAGQALRRMNDFIFTLKGLKPADGKTAEISHLIEKSEAKFRENMDTDFNISGALGVFFDFIHQVNLKQKELKKQDIKNILDFMARIDTVLGVMKKEEEKMLDAEIEAKIQERQLARKEKNFQLADAIRDELKSKGIILIDTPEGTRWKYEK
ncbi:MAG: cysteine--tRNA ligase [Candidatus Aminicenantes bacterium]|nr:cysteine--tRNA ligase [Candidatus Aminicenantes bacterium]NIM83117.1 cysteine--tRNA ligase [Candidatus Aminicenantes bacterium]NIN22496.1 cysteine--tRNA ligase [Candidatus Aminicenantes bacterium]NIN46264.1 cysteine--tRNA ligase [Candidatus Aminicenantes bacterium]NIN89101.1 cysteine--tRNA ligase [Candidatus Aminicenantes bacterium]